MARRWVTLRRRRIGLNVGLRLVGNVGIEIGDGQRRRGHVHFPTQFPGQQGLNALILLRGHFAPFIQ